MTKRQPLSPEAKAAATARLDEHIRSFCEWSEQRKQRARDVMDEELEEHLTGVLAELRFKPREA